MNIRTHYKIQPSDGEMLDNKPLECLDDLKPLTLAQQFYRFSVAGEKYELTRRKELRAINGDIDDPDDVRTELDVASDLHDVDKVIAAKIEAQKEVSVNKGKPIQSDSDKASEPQKSAVSEDGANQAPPVNKPV